MKLHKQIILFPWLVGNDRLSFSLLLFGHNLSFFSFKDHLRALLSFEIV